MPTQPVPSNAGIVLDPQSQQRIIPQSRRADGSVRKERKVKPGFTPAEDVTRFRSSRQQLQDAYAARGPPGSAPRPYVPGMDTGSRPSGARSLEQAFGRLGVSEQAAPSKSATTIAAARAGMTKSQKKNAKRREARQGGGADDDEEEEEEDGRSQRSKEIEVADDWDADDSTATPPPAPSVPEPTEADEDPAASRARRARAVAKKLRAAEALQERAAAPGAEALLPEQLAKVNAIEALRTELEELTRAEDA